MSAATQIRAANTFNGTGERLVEIKTPFHKPLSSSTHSLKKVANFGSLSNDRIMPPKMRVHNRFGGMRDLAFFRGDIRDLS